MMKKTIAVVMMLCVFMTTLCIPVLAEDAAEVTSVEELMAALEDEAVSEIVVTADLEITEPYVTITKKVTIASNVVFHPAPDDGFFVKSIMIEDGGKLVVTGKLTTMNTFDTGFAIAQILIQGGTFDVSEGSVNDDCNICYNSGTLAAPKGGFPEATTIACYLYGSVKEKMIQEKLELDGLRNITVQADCEIKGILEIPEGKELLSSAFIRVNDGAGISGNAAADAGCGYVVKGTGYVNEITTEEGMVGCVIVGSENGMDVYSLTDIQTWIEAKGEIENCALIVEVVDFLNPVYASVKDDSGSVNLFGAVVDGESMDLSETGIGIGDHLILLNPPYNEYDGNVEISEPVLIYCYRERMDYTEIADEDITYVANHEVFAGGDEVVVQGGDIIECFSDFPAYLAFEEEDLPSKAGKDEENGKFFWFNVNRSVWEDQCMVNFWVMNNAFIYKAYLVNADDPSIVYDYELNYKDETMKTGCLSPADPEHWFTTEDHVSLIAEVNGVIVYFRELGVQQD